MRRRVTTPAALLVCWLAIPAIASAQTPSVEMHLTEGACLGAAPAGEIRRAVAIELSPAGDPVTEDEHTRTRVSVRCAGDLVVIEVDDPVTGACLRRHLDLAHEAPSARVRTLALAVVEAVAASWVELEAAPGGSGSCAPRPAALTKTRDAQLAARRYDQMSTKTWVAALGFAAAAALAPDPGLAETNDEATCLPPAASERALQCPAGATASPGAARRSEPPTTVAAAQREPEGAGQDRPEPPGPGMEQAQTYELRRARQAQEARSYDLLEQQATLTRRLIATTREDDPELPRRRLVLAHIAEELARHVRAKVRSLDEPLFQARRQGNEGRAAELARQQRAFEREERRWRDAAIEQYEQVSRHHPDFPRRDEVLYRQAFLLEEQATLERLRRQASGDGDGPSQRERELRDRALRVYRELIRSFPQSSFVPFAYLSFGERYFEEGQMAEALRFYERVAEQPGSPVEGYALYKMAWCHINLGDDREALAAFFRVIEHARANPGSSMSRPLLRQARAELIGPFARTMRPGRAWEAFERVGGDMAGAMMERLAEHYFDQGQWADAAATYHSLMAHLPESEGLCRWQARVAASTVRGGTPDEQVLELRRTVDLMRTFTEGRHPAEVERECRTEAAQLVVETATGWHREAVGSDTAPGTGDEATLDRATQLYRLALEGFAGLDELELEGWPPEARPTRYRLGYWLAELLWQRRRWAECGPAFDRVVAQDPEGEHLREAAYAAVLCYDNLLQEQQEPAASATADQRRGSGEDEEGERETLRRRELTETERTMAAAFTRYLCFVSESDDRVRITYRLARIYYEANQLAEAATLFREIAFDHPDDELAPYAANLYLDSLNGVARREPERGAACRAEMSAGVDRFLADQHLSGEPEQRVGFAQLRCGLRWQGAEAFAEAGDHQGCARLYLSIYRDHRQECQQIGDHGLDEVLYNAALCLEADYRLGPAIEVRRRLIDEFGEGTAYAEAHGGPSPWAQRAIYQIGGNYHAIAAFSKAAEYYERYAERFPGEDKAPLALRNATVFRLGLGQHDRALKNADLFERNYGRRLHDDTATVLLSVGSVFLHNGQWGRAEDHYRTFLSRYGRQARPDEVIRARTALGTALWKQGGRARERALPEFRRAVALADRGRPDEETTRARLARYRQVIAPSAEAGPEGEAEVTGRLVRMVGDVAQARFFLAEAAYEAFAGIDVGPFRPSSQLSRADRAFWRTKVGPEEARRWEEALRYLPPDGRRREIATVQFDRWTAEELRPWLERKEEARARAEALYLEVVREDVPEWEIAAAARIGEMYHSMMQSFYDVPVPPMIQDDPELRDIYVGHLDELAEPYRQSAIDAFRHCLDEATSNRWFNRWSGRCELALNHLDPREYPLSDELRAEPNHFYRPLATPRILRTLSTTGD